MDSGLLPPIIPLDSLPCTFPKRQSRSNIQVLRRTTEDAGRLQSGCSMVVSIVQGFTGFLLLHWRVTLHNKLIYKLRKE